MGENKNTNYCHYCEEVNDLEETSFCCSGCENAYWKNIDKLTILNR